MLFNKKKKLLSYLLHISKQSEFLISEKELLKNNDYLFDSGELSKYLLILSNENYLDIIYTDRRGEPYFCVQILPKGKNYISDKKRVKKDLFLKLSLAIVSATITFLISKILYVIFS